ncbi:MAG: DUF3990 domain-containing protein [Prevotellaceae bacterium]|jgi:hypothetical protein|nr:DUF3990 domain-containing protein [Prevotellaceae bacterium]
MKVYHGSYMAIDIVDFSFCRKRRDFGKGFYVTKILSQAELWAARKGETFCTLKSLQAISKAAKYDFAYKLRNISKQIILTFVADKGFTHADAVDKLYNSKTFTQLADKTTQLYEKDWSEIYKLLLDELAIK